MCEKSITPPFHFDHLPTQVPWAPYNLKDSESAIIFAHFFGDLAPTDPLSQKSPKIWFFLFKCVLKLELWNIKVTFFFFTFGLLGLDMKICALPFFGKPIPN